MDKKSMGIIVVVILALVVGGVLVISSQNKNDNESTNNSSQNVSDTTSTTSTTTSTSNDTKNGRYQEATILDMLNVKIENKTLVMSVKGKNVKVSNLPSDIKYFSYVSDCAAWVEIAAITNSNEVYYAWTDLAESLINLDEEEETEESVISKANVEFEKIETDAVDLSVEIDRRDGVTCQSKFIGVINSRGLLKEIVYDEDKDKYVVAE